MLRPMPDSHLTPRLAKQLCTGLMLALAAACSSAAEPAPDTDPIARLIADKAFAGGEQMVLTAMGFLGVPYRRGGADVSAGFDCSGFTRHIVEASLGLLLPRRVDEQASASGLVRIARTELRPGDLVFFNTLKRTFSHVGIYIGEGKFIHAPRPGGEVRVEDMGFAYWAHRFTGARRIESVAAPAAAAAPAVVADATASAP
jgi:cell wall-associated NlpC family hydrolase